MSTCKTCRSDRVAVVMDYPHAKSFYGPLVRAMQRRFTVIPIPRSRAVALQDWGLVVLPFRDWAIPGSFVVDHAPLLGNRCTLQAQDFEVWASRGVERAAGAWGISARVASWPTGFFFMDQLDFTTYRPDVALAYFANREPRTDVAATLRVLCQRFARVLYCFHLMDPGWDVPVAADNLKRVKHGPAFWAALAQAGTVLCDYSSVVTVALGDPRKRLYSHQRMPRPVHVAARFFNHVVQRIAYTYTEDSLGRLLDEPDTRTRVRRRWAEWVHGPGLGKGATERVVDAMEQAMELRRGGACTGRPIRAILGATFAKEANMSRDDLELARVVIAGSGVDSGEPDYRIACEEMSRVCEDPGTKRCILEALDALRLQVATGYGNRAEPFVGSVADHVTLDRVLAEYLAEHPGTLPSRISVMELLKWHHGKTVEASGG